MVLQQHNFQLAKFTTLIFLFFFHLSFAQETSSVEHTIDWGNGESTTLTITDHLVPIEIGTYYNIDSSSYSTIYIDSYYSIQSDSSIEFNTKYDETTNQYNLNPNDINYDNDTLNFYSGKYTHYLNYNAEETYFVNSSFVFLRFRNTEDTTLTGKIPIDYSIANICKLYVVPLKECIERIGFDVLNFQEAKLDIVLANETYIDKTITFANIISDELFIKSTTDNFFLVVNSMGEILFSNLKTNVPHDISSFSTGLYFIKSISTGKSFRFLKL